MPQLQPLEARLQRHIEPDLNSGCWLWSGALSQSGYGVLKQTGTHLPMKAHRIAWRIFRGSEPSGAVLHKCDTRACVNPDHLFVGSHADNMLDMRIKGRQPNRRLNEAAVRDIKTKRLSIARYAKLYGVDGGTVRKVLKGITWAHIGDGV